MAKKERSVSDSVRMRLSAVRQTQLTSSGTSPPASYGDTSQSLIVAGFVGPGLMFPDAIVDFFAVNTQMVRNFEAKLDLSSLYAEDTDADIVTDMDPFSCAALQYLHTSSPC